MDLVNRDQTNENESDNSIVGKDSDEESESDMEVEKNVQIETKIPTLINKEIISKVIATSLSSNNLLKYIASNAKSSDPRRGKFLVTTNFRCDLDSLHLSLKPIVWEIFRSMIESLVTFPYKDQYDQDQIFCQLIRPVYLDDL